MDKYYGMSAYELEQERDRLEKALMQTEDENEMERLSDEMDEIDDIIDFMGDDDYD